MTSIDPLTDMLCRIEIRELCVETLDRIYALRVKFGNAALCANLERHCCRTLDELNEREEIDRVLEGIEATEAAQ